MVKALNTDVEKRVPRTAIHEKTIRKLWILTGGRCTYCNQALWYDGFSKRDANCAYIAHIVSHAPAGPRGDEIRSPELATDIRNLMLMCDTHHRMIDNSENRDRFSEAFLLQMKKEHEDRVEYLSSLAKYEMSHLVKYTAPIGANIPTIMLDQMAEAVLESRIPADKIPIDLGCSNSAFRDAEEDFWQFERKQLTRNFKDMLLPRIVDGSVKHISAFAIAPQPLLIELGRLISDIMPAVVYQKHRDTDNWSWSKGSHPCRYLVEKPRKMGKTVALNLSISGTIANERITSIVGEDSSVWKITVESPGNDLIKSFDQVLAFREMMRGLYDRIKSVHGHNTVLHVFPACPISLAVEIGRVWMPKADMTMRLYDENRAVGQFIHTFDITHEQ